MGWVRKRGGVRLLKWNGNFQKLLFAASRLDIPSAWFFSFWVLYWGVVIWLLLKLNCCVCLLWLFYDIKNNIRNSRQVPTCILWTYVRSIFFRLKQMEPLFQIFLVWAVGDLSWVDNDAQRRRDAKYNVCVDIVLTKGIPTTIFWTIKENLLWRLWWCLYVESLFYFILFLSQHVTC